MLKNGRVTANFNADMHAIFLDAKSTDELICFGSSNRSVQCLVSANPSVILRLQTKNYFTFWLILGLSITNLGLNESLRKRLIQKVK